MKSIIFCSLLFFSQFSLATVSQEIHRETVVLDQELIQIDFKPKQGTTTRYQLQLIKTAKTPKTVKLKLNRNMFFATKCQRYVDGSCEQQKIITKPSKFSLKLVLGSLPVGTEVNFLIDQYDLGINVLNGDYTNYFIEDHNLAGDISISFGRFSNKRRIYFSYLP